MVNMILTIGFFTPAVQRAYGFWYVRPISFPELENDGVHANSFCSH